MNKIQSNLLLLSLIAPGIIFAQGPTLKDLAQLVAEYLNIGLSLIIGLAVVVFVWNVFIYFFTEKDKTEAGKYVLFSVVGFFVILSFWGIVAIFINTLRLDSRQPSSVPSFLNFNGANTNSPSNTAPSVSAPTNNPSSGSGATTNTPSGSNSTMFNGPSGSPATGNSTGSGSAGTSNPPSASGETGSFSEGN
jgi:hypothetical protein